MITIASISQADKASREALKLTSEKVLSYSTMLESLDIKNIRELEDLVMECIYQGLLRAKLDQREQRIIIEWSYGRDVKKEDMPKLLNKLESWIHIIGKAEKEIESTLESCNQSYVAGIEDLTRFNKEQSDRTDQMLKEMTDHPEL